MAGIIHKIEETLHMGGGKGSEEKKAVEKKHEGEHKSSEGEKKEGLMDKIKDKIPGTQHGQEGEEKKNKKKKKEKKNKKEDGHGHGHDSSSSSDSD